MAECLQEAPPPKKKRRVLLGEHGTDDTDDPTTLAIRWANSLAADEDVESEASKSAVNYHCVGSSQPVAVWFPRHGRAVVTRPKGKMLSSMGEIGVGGQLLLYPEEALFLAERGLLALFHGGSTHLKHFSDCECPTKMASSLISSSPAPSPSVVEGATETALDGHDSE